MSIHVHSQATLFATGPTQDQAASDVRPDEVLNTRSRAISAVNSADGNNMDRQDGQDQIAKWIRCSAPSETVTHNRRDRLLAFVVAWRFISSIDAATSKTEHKG
jgi:hypothetical protein